MAELVHLGADERLAGLTMVIAPPADWHGLHEQDIHALATDLSSRRASPLLLGGDRRRR